MNKENYTNKNRHNISNIPCGVYSLFGNGLDDDDSNKDDNNKYKEKFKSKENNNSSKFLDEVSSKYTVGVNEIKIDNETTGVTGLSSFGYLYELATNANANILGGSCVPFSNDSSLVNITHTPGLATIIVDVTGIYEIFYSVNFTAGYNAQIALAVNGIVDQSTPVLALITAGELSGHAILSLIAGNKITLINNSLVSISLALSPIVGAQLTIKMLN